MRSIGVAYSGITNSFDNEHEANDRFDALLREADGRVVRLESVIDRNGTHRFDVTLIVSTTDIIDEMARKGQMGIAESLRHDRDYDICNGRVPDCLGPEADDWTHLQTLPGYRPTLDDLKGFPSVEDDNPFFS